MDLRAALAYAAAGGQALHLHRIIGSRTRAPRCFLVEVDAGRPIAHLFDADPVRLAKTVRRLGVRVVRVERPGDPRQHVDLCGKPLARAVAESDDQKAAAEIYNSFLTSEAVPDGDPGDGSGGTD